VYELYKYNPQTLFSTTSIHKKSEKGQVVKKISTEKEVKSGENIICLLYYVL